MFGIIVNKFVMDGTQLTSTQVADIYQSMLSGDKSALAKLQQVHVPPRSSQQFRPKAVSHLGPSLDRSQHNQQENSIIESLSAAEVQHRKQQMYLQVLKKGAKMGAIPRHQHVDRFYKPPRRLVNSTNQEYQSENHEKKRAPELPRQQLSMDLKSSHTAQGTVAKPSKVYALPKVPKPKEIAKVQSVQVTTKKQASSEPERRNKQARKTEKADFKQMIGRSKQQRQQFSKNNQQQLSVQMAIMQLHRSKKQFLDYVRDKFSLNFNHKHKYLKKKKKPQDIYHFQHKTPQKSQQALSPFKANLQHQKQKCNQYLQNINQLKMQYNANTAALTKQQNINNNMSFAKYLQSRRQDSITEISEEEDDTVEPLDNLQTRNNYKNIMAATREKKWSLKQRTEYEAQRTYSITNSRQTGNQSQFSRANQDKQNEFKQTGSVEQNKIVINERLKNLLFG